MRRYFQTFVQHLWLFLIPLFGLTVVGVLFIRPIPSYTATASIWVDQSLPSNVQQGALGNTLDTPATRESDHLLELLNTISFLDAVSNGVEKAGIPLSPTQKAALETHINKTIIVTADSNNTVSLSYADISSSLTLIVVQKVIESFQAELVQTFETQGQTELKLLNDNLTQAKAARDAANTQIKQYAIAHPGVLNLAQFSDSGFPVQSTVNDSTIDSLEPQLVALVVTQEAAQKRFASLQLQFDTLQLGYNSLHSGQSNFLHIADAPYISSKFAFSSIQYQLVGGVLGLGLGVLATIVMVLITTWTDKTLTTTAWARSSLLQGRVYTLADANPQPRMRPWSNLRHIGRFIGLDTWGVPALLLSSDDYQRRDKIRLIILTVLSIGLVGGFSRFGTTPDVAYSLIAAVLLGAIICRWPVMGYFSSIFIVLVCELFSVPDVVSTYTSLMLTNLHTFTFIPISATPLEVIIGLTIGAALIQARWSRHRFFDRSITAGAMVLFGGFLAFGYLYGVYIKHGSGKVAQWEVRGLVYLIVFYFLTVYFFHRNIRAWRAINWVLPGGLAVQCLIVIARNFTLPDTQEGLYADSINGFNHDTAILCIILLVWCIAKLILESTAAEKWAAALFTPLSLTCILLSNRRAAFASLAVCLLVLMMVLWLRRRRLAIVLVVLLALILPPYIVVFSNVSGPLGLAARAFSSTSAAPGSRDYNSDLYRIVEKTNVRLTIREQPLFGVGFGQPFTVFIASIALDNFVFQYYTPHVQILWIWLKLGIGGWLVFWFIFCSSLFKLGQVAKRAPPSNRFTICIIAGCILVIVLVFAYVDVSLNNPRLLTLMGMSVGMLELAYRSLRQSKTTDAPHSRIEPALSVRNSLRV